MESDKSRLIKNFLSLISLRGLEFLIPLLTIPYLLRTIGVEKYGMVGFAYAFAAYFGAVVQYGFGITATRDIARSRQDAAAVSHLYSVVLTSSVFLALAAIAVALIILAAIPALRSDWPLHLLSLAQVVLQSLFPIWLFQGMERMSFITYLNLGSKIFFIVGLFLIVRQPDDYIYVPLLNLASASIVLLCSFWIASRVLKIGFRVLDLSSIRETLVNGRHSFINQFAPNLYNNSATFLLGLYSGGYEVGVYTAATKVTDAASSLGYILSNTFLPYLSRNIGNHGKFKKVMISGGLIGMLSIFAFAGLIGQVLHPVDGPAIAELLRYLSPSVLMLFLILTFSVNYLMLRDKEKKVGKITFWVSILFFFIALFAIPLYGIAGCVVTVVGARTTISALFYHSYKKLVSEGK